MYNLLLQEDSALTISIVMCTYNAEEYLSKCIKSLLDQTIKDFEIVIVDDGSTDNTPKIIERFEDKRIKYFRNKNNSGIPQARNKGVKLSRGQNLFFTDSDCVVAKSWLEQGLKSLKEKDCVGVEGKTYYVSEDYEATYSDRIIKNEKPGLFMTCNIAYKKSFIEKIGGFDERYNYFSDRDLALRVVKFGKILFNPDMMVYHQKRIFKPVEFIHMAKSVRSRVLLYKKFREERRFVLLRIAYPLHLMALIFPPLVLGSFLLNRYRTKEDLVLFPYIYIRLIYERLNLWDMCARERVFLI